MIHAHACVCVSTVCAAAVGMRLIFDENQSISVAEHVGETCSETILCTRDTMAATVKYDVIPPQMFYLPDH